MRWQVSLLAGAQALLQTASVLVMTIGGLAGALVAPTASLATVSIATMFLGTAVATFPAPMWMTGVGRRTGFVLQHGAGSSLSRFQERDRNHGGSCVRGIESIVPRKLSR